MIERIKQFIDYQAISISTFEKKIGASEGVIRKSVKNKTDIQSKWISQISENYPKINPEWLITGKGSMLRDSTPVATTSNDQKGIPLIPLDAMAGVATGEVNVLELDCERFIVPTFKGADYLITVKGSSMQPKYYSGDVVACKKVPLQDLFFQWNKVYVLDTNQGPLVKRIEKSDNKDSILCVSDNESYSPFDLPKSHINAIAIVMGVIRLE